MTARWISGLKRASISLVLAVAAPPTAESGPAPASAIAHPRLWPAAASPSAITNARTEAFITRLMRRMTLEEKVGQTIDADISAITPDDLRRYPIGALLAGGNSGPYGDDRAPAARWVELMRAFRVANAARPAGHAVIPVMFGIDAVHGHNNIIGATIYPHNIGLGAARDPELIGEIGRATAQEAAVTGVDWTFGPTLAVPRDVRWGRSYEGYSEDPAISTLYAGPMTLGLQGALKPGQPLAGDRIIGSAKHFLADGGTLGGRDQGDAEIPESELIRIHAQAYPKAIDAGILTVMVSFSSWNGVRHIANRSLLTGVLKGRMGFEGFVVGDWNAHAEVPGCSPTSCPAAMNAGLDMFMAPDSWKGLYQNTLAQVRAGRIPMARLDDAVRRILRVKVKAGLFDRQRPLEGRYELLGSPEHRALARRAVRESLALLKNDGVLPVKASARVLVAGDGADDIGKQSGGWTISWQGAGNTNADFPNGQSIWGGIAEAVRAGGGQAELAVDGKFKVRPDVAIVVFGENPYAEFQGDIPSVDFEAGDRRDLALIRSLKARNIPVVSVFLSGRPLWTNPEINASDAFVAAWLPGSEGGGVADLLIGKADGAPRYDFRGRLSYSWPRRADQVPLNHGEPGYDPQFAYGYGLSYAHGATVAPLSEDPGHPVLPPNLEAYFVDGRSPAPWSLAADGAASLRAIDAGAQENAREASWSGDGAGSVTIAGPAADLSRQANGDMALRIRYRLDAAPTGPVRLSLACGAGCGASADLADLLIQGAPGEWRTAQVRLSCFRAAGVDMSRVTEPFRLSTDGRLALAFSEIRLGAGGAAGPCPPMR